MRNVIADIQEYLIRNNLSYNFTYTSSEKFHDTLRIDAIMFAWDVESLDGFLDNLQSESTDKTISWITSQMTSHESTFWHARIIVK